MASETAGAPKPKRRRAARTPGASPWYTVSDMMRLFDVTDKTIWKWAAAGKLPEPRRRGRRWTRWPRQEVDALLRAWGAEPAQQ